MSLESGIVTINSSTTPVLIFTAGLTGGTIVIQWNSGDDSVLLGDSDMDQNTSVKLTPYTSLPMTLALLSGDKLYGLKTSSASIDPTVRYLSSS